MGKKTNKEFTEITDVFKISGLGLYIEYNGVLYKKMPQNRQKPEDGIQAYILELFEDTFKRYARRDAKAQAYKTWVQKFKNIKDRQEVLERARNIFKAIMIRQKQFQMENRELKYYPMFSTLLNSEIV